ncbi:hypothetical protein [Amycolatopsis sp. CA-230715]|uniref:hypothetical protein n=1 Tax=Amycolatopsis sp. CA-230715 TaxID=2745196 RepID=UPI001C32249A|nr:hypothetical protein [Amycolatopsis sp. CA-230715]QWF77201.1 hypothetical protein HUW46_00584 [Amycolatopsis sp. CA-230715]
MKPPRDEKGRFAPYKTKARATVAAAATAGVVAFGGGGAGGGAASVGSGAESGAGSVNAVARSVGKDLARKGLRREALKKLGFKIAKEAVKTELRCATASFGRVRQFFLAHPCRKLDRQVIAVGDGAGNTVAVSIVWVRMRSGDQVTGLKDVIDEHGSGDISPLGGAVLGLAGVKFTGEHYDSRADGSLLVIAETEAAGGHSSDRQLDDAAHVASLFPPL